MQGIFNIDRFFGGISNDEYSGTSGTLFEAKNVDLSNSKGVILSRSGELFSDKNLVNNRSNGETIGMIIGDFPNFGVLSKDGKIKFYGVSSAEITLASGTYRNIGVIQTNTGIYGFILVDNKVLRWSYNNSDSILGVGALGVNITTHLTLTTGLFDQKAQYLQNGDILYITGGNKIFAIGTSTSTWTEDLFIQIDYGYNITYISEIGDQIVIYANNGTHGKQYFWDGLTEAPERVIDWYDKPILGGVTLNNIDYVITGTKYKREFYIVNGYQPQIVSQTDVYTIKTTADKFYYSPDYPNSLETIGKTIIIPGISQIYKYGNNVIGLPNGFTRDFLNTTNSIITTIFYQDSFRSGIHLFYSEGNNHYYCLNQLQGNKNSVNYPTYKPGSIKTLRFDNNNYSQKKQGLKYRIGYDLPTNTSINIYTKVNNKGNYADFYITSTYTTAPTIGATYTFDSKTFTVYNITSNPADKNGGLIVHCTYTGDYDTTRLQSQYGTITKATGTGDSILNFTDVDYGFNFIQKVSTNNNYTGMYNDYFNEIQFKFDLITNDKSITPNLKDFKLLFNIIEDDLK